MKSDLVLLCNCRIDAECSSLRRKLIEMTISQMPINEGDEAAEETEAKIKV